MNEIINQIFNYMNIYIFGHNLLLSERQPYFQRLKLPAVTIAINDFDSRQSAC